jgi:alkanesulfonate monooxygenase SsuD/methylene tetrahydromethanopterin reductase-like flavin-dependent oxidoreductase (luciferase family)
MKFYLFLPGQWWDRSRPVKEIYDEMVEQAIYADELGYDGLWLAEQNLVNFLAAPDPLQLGAVIASKTKNIRIGIGVFVLPFHHPLRLAAQIGQIDQLAGGRFDVAAGRGASPHQMRQFQVELSPDDSRAFFDEHLGIMVRHWESARSHAFKGRFFEYGNATVLPPTVQRPHPRLWIAALSPDSAAWAMKLGYDSGLLFSPFREPFSHVEAVYASFETAIAESGRDRSTTPFAVNRMTFVGESEADAREVLRYVVMNHRVIDMQLDDKETVLDGNYAVEHQVRDDEPEVEEMYENIAYGDLELVREKVRRYADLGVDMFSAWMNIGQDHERVMRSMEVFAKEIMPEFHDVPDALSKREASVR